MDYRILSLQDEEAERQRDVGGLMQLTEEMCQGGAKPVWLGYIAVDDVDQTVANIAEKGFDPQGALFALVGARK